MEKKTKIILIVSAIIVLLGVILGIFIFAKGTKAEKNYVDFVRTYNIISLDVSDEADYVNITIRNPRTDTLHVVKVARDLIEDEIIEDAPYEFTFDYSGPVIEDTVPSIFENMTLKSVKLSNKTSLEERQDTL